jgi:AcrR family transcriptional regulator
MNKRSGIKSKERIIDAAMDIFSRKGFATANIREIAKAAGISVGGLYIYFRNKEDLYKSLIEEKKRSLSSMIEMTLGQTHTAAEALSSFMKLYLDYAVKHKDFILLHIREHGFTFEMDKKRAFFRQQAEIIEKIIIKGMRSGEFRRCNGRETARIIIASLRGIVLSMALDKDVVVKPEMLNQIIFQGLLMADKKDLRLKEQ